MTSGSDFHGEHDPTSGIYVDNIPENEDELREAAELLKKQFPQLFCRIDVKGLFGEGENQFLTFRDPLGQHIAKLLQLICIDENAPFFHPVKHLTQGQFNILIQAGHAVCFQLLLQRLRQIPDGFGTGSSILILHADPQEIGCQLGHGIV